MSDTAPEVSQPGPSLVLRLVRSALYWVLPVLILTAVSLTWIYRTSTYRIFDDPLESAITSLIASSSAIPDDTGSWSLSLTSEPIDPRYQRALSGRYWLIGYLDATGNVQPLRSSRSMAGETLILPVTDTAAILRSSGEELRSVANGPDRARGEKLRVIARSVILPGMEDTPVAVIAAADSQQAIDAIRRFALLASGLLLLLSSGLMIGVLSQVRSGLKPLFDLRNKVADVREGRSERVDGQYPSEIAPLADELNTLIDHNRDVVERARTHVSNLAHALKTPLAVLINEAGTSDSQLAEVVARQSQTMKNQVDHHLQRARAAARGQVIGVSTPVEETLMSLVRTLERIYRDKDIDFGYKIEKDLMFRGEKRDLEEMAGNLLDNACKWTASRVALRAYSVPDNETDFMVVVEDDGPGVDQSQYAEALKRGARLDEATPGTGFGLAIVDDLSQAYKGGLVLDRSEWGGLKVTLTLPRRKETT